MSSLRFNCFNCHQESPFELTSEERDTVARMLPDHREKKEMTFLCTNCGYANRIEVSLEMAETILARLSSGDLRVEDAIDMARKRFGF